MYIPTALFNTDIFWSIVKWLMILLVWGIFAYGNWREDRKVKQLLEGGVSEADADALLKTLHRRDIQIWVQLTLLLFVVAAGDLRHDAALLPADFFTPPLAAPPPSPMKETTSDEKYDAVLKKNSSSALPFSNITEFNEQNSKREAYIDWLKERYESWLVTYYYLEKCKKVGSDDFDIIHRSLVRDLKDAGANDSVENNIMVAAAGSYKEMYGDIPCDGQHMAQTKSMYDVNMQQVRQAKAPNNAGAKQPAAATVTTGR